MRTSAVPMARAARYRAWRSAAVMARSPRGGRGIGSTPKCYVTERLGGGRCASRRLPVDFAAGHYGPDDPRHFVCEGNGREFARLAAEQLAQPWRGQLAVRPAGVPDHRGGTGHQPRPQPFMARAADPAQALLAAGGMLARGQAEPGREVTARLEGLRVNLDRQGERDERADPWDGGQQLADRIGPVHPSSFVSNSFSRSSRCSISSPSNASIALASARMLSSASMAASNGAIWLVPLAAMTPNSAAWLRSVLIRRVRWPSSVSRTFRTRPSACCSSVLARTKCMP